MCARDEKGGKRNRQSQGKKIGGSQTLVATRPTCVDWDRSDSHWSLRSAVICLSFSNCSSSVVALFSASARLFTSAATRFVSVPFSASSKDACANMCVCVCVCDCRRLSQLIQCTACTTRREPPIVLTMFSATAARRSKSPVSRAPELSCEFALLSV